MADVFKRAGRDADALQLYEEIIRRQPEYPNALQSFGALLVDVGRVHDAIDAYQHALRLRPGAGYVAAGEQPMSPTPSPPPHPELPRVRTCSCSC